VDHCDLLDLLIAVRDPETGEPLAADEVRDQCAGMIFGGYETTARLLFWASYLLTLDHGEQARLRDEVAAFPPERVATLDDLGRWPRQRLVLLEALRLYPPVPILVREPIEDDVIMGEPVRRGVQVYIAPWVLHRHRNALAASDGFHAGQVCGADFALDIRWRLFAVRRWSSYLHRRGLRSFRGPDYAGDGTRALHSHHREQTSRHAGRATFHPTKLRSDIQA
jgi:hypothetical protein